MPKRQPTTWADCLMRHPYLLRWEGTGHPRSEMPSWAESGVRYMSNERLARATIADYVNACLRRHKRPVYILERWDGREWVEIESRVEMEV